MVECSGYVMSESYVKLRIYTVRSSAAYESEFETAVFMYLM